MCGMLQELQTSKDRVCRGIGIDHQVFVLLTFLQTPSPLPVTRCRPLADCTGAPHYPHHTTRTTLAAAHSATAQQHRMPRTPLALDGAPDTSSSIQCQGLGARV